MGKTYYGAWLTAFGIAGTLHAAAWYGLAQQGREMPADRPETTVEVSLVSPPPQQPQVVPPVASPPPPRQLPQKTAALPPQPVAEPVAQPVAEELPQQPVAVPQPQPAAPAAVASAPAQPVQEPVVEPPRFNAAYLDNPPPAYPLSARRRGIEGRVWVRAEVLNDGRCNMVALKQSSGFDLLDQAALAAVKGWRFVPAKQGERTITAWVDVPIVFRLQEQ